MDMVTERVQKEALIALFNENAAAQKFLKWLSSRDRDATETSVDRVAAVSNTDRPSAIALMRAVAETGVAEFYTGRRGYKTRLVWNYSCKSVGQAAMEPTASLKISQLDQSEEEDIPFTSPQSIFNPIKEAKKLISESLGVKEENIEITIRS